MKVIVDWEKIEAEGRRLAEAMPTEADAVRALFDAYERLREVGWRPGIYAPKDGTVFLTIEPGSTGIHKCNYSGEWPNGFWHFYDSGDVYPTRSAPVLFRLPVTALEP